MSARLLEQTLDEEKAADRTLTHIAKSSVNEDAAKNDRRGPEDGPLMRSAEWAGRTSGMAVQQSRTVRRAASAVGVVPERSSNRSSGSTRTGSSAAMAGCAALSQKTLSS